MSILYNKKLVAGKYKEQIINNADTINAGIIKISTQEEVDSGIDNTTAVTPLYLSNKQDKLIAGDGIIIDENLIECTIYPDEQTIVQNESGTITSIGQLTKSGTIKFDWEGTEAEYTKAMTDGVIQPDWYCYITDDESIVDYGDVANQTLSNLRLEGEEKLNISKMYYTNDVYTEEKGYNQLLEMKRSTFDLSKFTVVGSPIITDDGVASGFLKDTDTGYDINANGVTIKNFSVGMLKDKPYKISCTFECKDGILYTLINSTSAGWVAWSNSLIIGNGELRIESRFGTEENHTGNIKPLAPTSLVLLNMSYGQIYTYQVEFDGTSTYKYTILDNKGLIIKSFTYIPTTDDKNLYIVNTKPTASIIIGCGNYAYSTQYIGFRGSINLKQFSITVDGKEVFNGNKNGLDVIKTDNYEVIGSPTITEDGIVSDFSTSNIIELPAFVHNNRNWKIELDFIFNNADGYLYCAGNDIGLVRGVRLRCSKTAIILGLSFDGSALSKSLSCPVNLQNFKRYNTMIEFTGERYNVYLDGIKIGSIENNTPIWSNTNDKFYLGVWKDGNGFQEPYQGSIDLNSFKIFVDEQLVYQPCLKIPYNVSKTGSKIVPAYARNRVIDLYEQEGHAEYYTIDEENKNFTLPMGEIYGIINNKANVDLSNLSSVGEKHFLNKSQITNCITEIPQRIKLELNNGVLTLKAGSEVIVPNGFEANGTTPKFDYITIESDVTYAEPSSIELTAFTFYNPTNNTIFRRGTSPKSGTSVPSGFNSVYYNTATNTCHNYSNGVQYSQVSLPICICSSIAEATNNIVSINQVFNGFGYIGSTLWCDKGVKYLSPNGKHGDGTLRNSELATKKLMTDTLQTESRTYFINEANWSRRVTATCFEQSKMPALPLSTNAVWFNTDENQMYASNTGETVWHKIHGYANIGTAGLSDFTFKQPFRTVDYNDYVEKTNYLEQNSLNKQQITNCITEIPQRIKLELNDGVFTLKAGSVVIVPNGFEANGTTPKFDYVVATSDFSNATETYAGNTEVFLFADVDNGEITSIYTEYKNKSFSGTVTPTITSNYDTWYDTNVNLVKRTSDNGATWVGKKSLPLNISYRENGLQKSLGEVFNGFGYIGSTFWVDKGVKALAPNGKNIDGSLKNYEITTTQISIYTRNLNNDVPLWLNTNGTLFLSAGIAYDEKRNVIYSISAENQTSVRCQVAMTNLTNGVVNSFNPKQPFRAVDYNDMSEVTVITETYKLGHSWYRIYSDGWCEQGGVSVQGTSASIIFLKPFKDTNYSVTVSDTHLTVSNSDTGGYTTSPGLSNYTTTGFRISQTNGRYTQWEAKGYIS